MELKEIRSISFDTSFLLKPYPSIDKILKMIVRDNIACFVTSTVVSELEQLKIWGRISDKEFRKAMSRWKRTNAKVIDFRNRILSSALNQECVLSMGKHHGVAREDIINDCNIIITSLKNGIDLFLSEDFHFTSKVTETVLDEIINNACTEYKQICDSELFSLNSSTFLNVYKNNKINLDELSKSRKDVRKPTK